MPAKSEMRFRVLIYFTIVLTYLVILAGAVVRTTQSGMGCPDWPKCFGRWIPPTEVTQLPENYQEIYAHRGYADTTFNVYHTWVEYVNRLLGALLGIVIFAAVLFSLPYRKTNPRIFWLTCVSFLLIGFQGWLGSLVVASNLAPVKITIHMITALLLLALLVYIHHLISPKEPKSYSAAKLINWIYLSLAFTVIQVVLGTQVRQEVDVVAKALEHTQRDNWIAKLSLVFAIHRSFSIAVTLLNGWIIFKALKLFSSSEKIKMMSYLIGALLISEIAVGIILNYFSFPAALQPMHLLIASLLFGFQFRFMLLLKNTKQ